MSSNIFSFFNEFLNDKNSTYCLFVIYIFLESLAWKLGMKDWMVQAVIPNNKQIMTFGNEPVIADKLTIQAHDEKYTEDFLKSIVN